MDNSGRYAKEGGVVVGITVTEARSGGARNWSIEVSDNGPGIPDARKAAIMPSLPSEMGINRGVASSLQFYSLVLAHFDGSITIGDRVPGEPDKGARVVITIPEAKPHG
jgi:K+-sensing histidine kinase KdpD